MFNVGAKVRCVKGTGISVIDGAFYTVSKVNCGYVYFKETHGGWAPDRFELVDDGRTSRTTDPITSKGKRKVNKYEQAVLTYLGNGLIVTQGTGATGKELAKYSGHPLNCITPRFAPLRRKGLIKAAPGPAPMYGELRRDKQIVWVLT